MGTKIKLASVTAIMIEVGCPHCGEPFPNPENGSDMWPVSLLQHRMQTDRECSVEPLKRKCNACEQSFFLDLPSKVMVAPY